MFLLLLLLRDNAEIQVDLQAVVVRLGDLVPDPGMAGAEHEGAAMRLALHGRPARSPRLLIAAVQPAGRLPVGETAGHPLRVDLLEDSHGRPLEPLTFLFGELVRRPTPGLPIDPLSGEAMDTLHLLHLVRLDLLGVLDLGVEVGETVVDLGVEDARPVEEDVGGDTLHHLVDLATNGRQPLGSDDKRLTGVFLDDFHYSSFHRSERIQETGGHYRPLILPPYHDY